ncbi:MAG: hypothetical protein U9N34_06600 [Candidatus Cloacimonadota bacterium]|nr:hypothetical protein [Candidatus Cloacimonadota bacterium]
MTLSETGLKLNRAVFVFFYLLFLIFFTANLVSADCTGTISKADGYSCYGRCEDAKLILSITKNQDMKESAQHVIDICQHINQFLKEIEKIKKELKNKPSKSKLYLRDIDQYVRSIKNFTAIMNLSYMNLSFDEIGSDSQYWNEKISYWKNKIKNDPDCAYYYYPLANAYKNCYKKTFLDDGPYEYLVPKLINIVCSLPQENISADFLSLMAGCLSTYKLKISVYEYALMIEPENQKVLFELGSAYSRKGRTSDAMKIYKKLKTLNKKKADLLFSEII